MKSREEQMRSTNESTNSRVLYFSIFSMICLGMFFKKFQKKNQKNFKKKFKKNFFDIFEKLLKSRLGHVASLLPSPLLQIEKTNRISAIFYSCSKRKGRRGLFCLSPLLFAEAVLSRIVLPLLIILSPTVKIYYSNYGFY